MDVGETDRDGDIRRLQLPRWKVERRFAVEADAGGEAVGRGLQDAESVDRAAPEVDR